MATSGVLTFHACHNSGIMISQLGSGTYDHMGFFGAGGVNDPIIVNQWNASTWVVSSTGARNPAEWGALVNNKWIDSSGCSSSGMPRKPVSDYQDVAHISSGTLLVRFQGTAGLQVDTYNAKLYSYDNTASYYTSPSEVTMMGFEINPSGALISGYDVTTWSAMGSISAGINFVDHSPATNYMSNSSEHLWYCAVSSRADAVGFLDEFSLVFVFQFA